MAVLFSESKTKQNLMRAFAGEGQARNRYTFAAEQARKEGKPAIADIFLYTADQERAHAGSYYELLKEASGTNIFIDGSYPVDETKTLVQLLRASEHNEQEEAEDVYPAFADVAKQEGFFEVAATFQQIAEIEAAHSQRFRKIADSLENNTFICVKMRMEQKNGSVQIAVTSTKEKKHLHCVRYVSTHRDIFFLVFLICTLDFRQ